MEHLTSVISDAFPALLILIPTWGATGYLWRIYLADDPPRSWLAWTICVAATIKSIAGTWLGFVYVYRIRNDGIAPDDWRILTGLVIILLVLAPVGYALQFERRRRASKKEAPYAPRPYDHTEAPD